MVPSGLAPVLLIVIALGAVVAVVAAALAGQSVGRTLLVLVVGVPAAYGLGVLSRGAGELRWPIGVAFAVVGMCLALVFCRSDGAGERR